MPNPYQPPQSQQEETLVSNENPHDFKDSVLVGQNKLERHPAVSPAGTTVPRHMAAIIDNVFAAILGVLVAQQFPDDWVVPQAICLAVLYFAYYLLFEILFSATPGKLLMGLKILAYNGEQCSRKQILIRTLFRIVEVNPILLGALPAAARIVTSRDKQRFGDKVADTIVVFRSASLQSG